MSVAGKHQCRALAENMYSPNEGLKEINHQLSTGIAQELIHYCNSLGQGVSDCLFVCAHLCVQYRHINAWLSVPQMAIWIPCWIVPLWTATSHLPYPVVRNQLKRGVLKPDIVQRIHTHSVQKTHQALKREPQVPKTPVQVRNRQVEVYVYGMHLFASLQCENTLSNSA